MAEFLTTSSISANVEEIIKNAKKEIVIVSPYLKVSSILIERLREASTRGSRVVLVYGKCDLSAEMEEAFDSIPKLEKFFHPNLHAKCYLNERRAIITSMNLHEYSESKNREMGVSFDKDSDGKLYSDARVEVISIIKASTAEKKALQPRVMKPRQSTIKKTKHQGYCIRCGKPIPFNPDRPYCRDCFEIWAQFENPEYEESVCHSCGEFYPVNMLRPLCRSCFKKTSFF